MERTDDVVGILEEEYGIKSMAELNAAIARLGFIDLSPFCGEIPKQGKEKVS